MRDTGSCSCGENDYCTTCVSCMFCEVPREGCDNTDEAHCTSCWQGCWFCVREVRSRVKGLP